MEKNIVYVKIIIPNPESGNGKAETEESKINRQVTEAVSKALDKYTPETRYTLLNYPVVYIHKWVDSSGKERVYVGETIDLLRRTEEHQKKAENDSSKWQTSWLNGSGRSSYFFSSREMNKSIALDLENCLIELYNKQQNLSLSNGRDNEQGNYSNKDRRDDLLNEICGILGIENTIKRCDPGIPSDEKPSVFYEVIDPNTFDPYAKINGKALFNDRPVIYLHMWYEGDKLKVYTGETTDICKRTKQHIEANDEIKNTYTFEEIMRIGDDPGWHESWRRSGKAYMLVFSHKQFNVSVTRDIENLLIIYMRANGYSVNGRGNEQREYNNRDKMRPLFEEIVRKLSEYDATHFPTLDELRDRSPFLASPIIELSPEQRKFKNDIAQKISDTLKRDNKKCQVMIVTGSAGTGKTVLVSSLFFDLCDKVINTRLLVNNDRLRKAYKSQAETYFTATGKKDTGYVTSAQTFLNSEEKVDVVMTDEAHLLFTENHMHTVEEQIRSLCGKCRILVLMTDPEQFVKAHTIFADDIKSDIEQRYRDYLGSDADVRLIGDLKQQFRMDCSENTLSWIKSIPAEGADGIKPFPYGGGNYEYSCEKDRLGSGAIHKVTEMDNSGNVIYEIAVFEELAVMTKAIEQHKNNHVLAALLASYCWKEAKPIMGNWVWHKKDSKRGYNGIWTKTESLKLDNGFYEVGSYHDIQGFDLEYAGVILGESLKIMDGGPDIGKVRLNPGNDGRRGLTNNTPNYKDLISNEINVLLTRGKKGLYIYAVNNALREALIEAIKRRG